MGTWGHGNSSPGTVLLSLSSSINTTGTQGLWLSITPKCLSRRPCKSPYLQLLGAQRWSRGPQAVHVTVALQDNLLPQVDPDHLAQLPLGVRQVGQDVA